MSYFLFIDESGHDRRESPYEVLAGVIVEDVQLWPLIQAVQRLELECFGQRYADGERELKAKKLLKRKVFRHASQAAPIEQPQRTAWAQRCLADGASATSEQMAALGQAKLDFVRGLLALCSTHRCQVVASAVVRGAPRLTSDFLRKDYAYLFERFFYFLEDRDRSQGLVVFDELERTQSHLLVDQMTRYFSDTQPGRARSEIVIPEPFFVHSHLTTGVQLADLVAYVTAWGMQVGSMPAAERPELLDLGQMVAELEFHTDREKLHYGRHQRFSIHGITVLDDLRPREHRS